MSKLVVPVRDQRRALKFRTAVVCEGAQLNPNASRWPIASSVPTDVQ